MIADYHMHTNFSVDSKVLMEEYCAKAISIGIEEICFTDHVDHGIEDMNNLGKYQVVYYPKYFEKIAQLQEKYKGVLKIKAGIEFGVQLHNIDLFNEDFKRWNFDFVLLSVHQIEGMELWINEFQKNKAQSEYNEGYYNYLLDLVKQYDNFNCIGHLDLIRRYDDSEYSSDKCFEIISEILKVVISKGKGIELNTSSFRYKLKDFMPSRKIWEKYKELGGEILTVGSDSHLVDCLGENFKECFEMLKDVGFTHYCVFDKGLPTKVLIP